MNSNLEVIKRYKDPEDGWYIYIYVYADGLYACSNSSFNIIDAFSLDLELLSTYYLEYYPYQVTVTENRICAATVKESTIEKIKYRACFYKLPSFERIS